MAKKAFPKTLALAICDTLYVIARRSKATFCVRGTDFSSGVAEPRLSIKSRISELDSLEIDGNSVESPLFPEANSAVRSAGA